MRKDSGIRNCLSKVGKILLVVFVFLVALQVMPKANVKANSSTDESQFFSDEDNINVEPTEGNNKLSQNHDRANVGEMFNYGSLYEDANGNEFVTITAYNKDNNPDHPNLIIPEKDSHGHTIIQISSDAFKNAGLTSVVIPDTCTEIYSNAFSFNKLSSVKLPSNLKVIRDELFANNAELKEIEIPDSVTTIENSAFFNTGLESIVIPDGVKTFGTNVFSGAKLTSVKLPSGLEKITQGMFINNNMLKHIDIPDSVKEIEDSAFDNCGLESVKLPSSLESIGRRAFMYNKLLSVTIPDSVTSIADPAFSGQKVKMDYLIKGATYIITLPKEINMSNFGVDFDVKVDRDTRKLSIPKTTTSDEVKIGYNSNLGTFPVGDIYLSGKITLGNEITNIPPDVTLGGEFNYKTKNGSDTSEDIDYSSNDTYVEPSNVPQTYKNNDQSYRFDKWSFDVEDAVVNGKVEKSFIATAQYIKTFEVTQTDEDGTNGVSHTVDINADLTASPDNGGISLVEPTKEGYSFIEWVYDVVGADVTNVTKNFRFRPIFMTIFQIDENKNWVSGSNEDLSIKSDGPFNDFIQVSVDDEIVDRKNYTVKSGSTIIEFKASYLNSLSVGIHNLVVEFTKGISIGNFEIKRVVSPDVPSTPSSSTGVRSEKYELIQAVKAISKVNDDSEFTKSEVNKIIAAKEALNKLITEGNPYKLTKKELETVEGYKPTINKLYNKLVLAGTVAGFGWIDAGNGDWYYFNEDGTKSTKWVAAGTYWYYVKEGLMLRNSWIAQDATGYIWYYVNDLGEMVTNTTIDGYLINIHGEWYNN